MLYLRYSTFRASPTAISGRTSYIPVRLAFYPYPQLIPQLCNVEGFGPPRSVTFASPWSWVAHRVSCPILATSALLRLAFAVAPGVTPLTLPQRLTRRVILQKARDQAVPIRRWANALSLIVSIRFQVLFHSGHPGSFRLSLTVLVHYRSPRVFSLGKWASRLPAGLACPAVLENVTGV